MKANLIRLYKHYCEMAENPIGDDTIERINVRNNAEKAKADLEIKFKNSNKYKDDPEIKKLLGKPEEKKEEEVKEVKKKKVVKK